MAFISLQQLPDPMMFTDRDQAADFVARTGLDALAIDRIAAIQATVPDTHRVMRGASSVPQQWLAVSRAHGGDIRETHGVPVEEVRRGILNGVRKVTIDTDIRLAMTGAMCQALAEDPGGFEPRKALIAAKKATPGICQDRFDAFGCTGQASRIKPVALDHKVKRCL